MITREDRMTLAAFGAAETDDDKPTVGVSISPWIIGLAALVWLMPKMYAVHRATRQEKK
jgi:hypothetical protein